MSKRKFVTLALLVIVVTGAVWWYAYLKLHQTELEISERDIAEKIGLIGKVAITILYDNNPYDQRLKTAWGFSCLIDTMETKILFDTGRDSNILLGNIAKLGIDVRGIQIVVLSHIHEDHVGGLFGILEKNSYVKVYVPLSFTDSFKLRVKQYGCEIVDVGEAANICEGVATTGELGIGIKEQSLIVNTWKGLVVITGCAHPGIVNIVRKAKQLIGEVIYLVIGGFHLGGASEDEILSIIEQLKSLGVAEVAPCHCTGDLARRMFEEAFGENYVEAGVGRIIDIQQPPYDLTISISATISSDANRPKLRDEFHTNSDSLNLNGNI